MTTFRSEETLVGIISLAALGWVIWIMVRGVREQRLPIGKSMVRRDERAAAFHGLFAFYIAAAGMLAFIGLDLLFGFTGKS